MGRLIDTLKNCTSPFWRWTLCLVLLPTLELFLLLCLFPQWAILLGMFVCGLIGVAIAYREGLRHWIELNQQLDRGMTPMMPVFHCGLILLAALLMILPGVLTCLLGLLLLFPITRSFVVSYMVLQFESHRLQPRQSDVPHSPDVIDV